MRARGAHRRRAGAAADRRGDRRRAAIRARRRLARHARLRADARRRRSPLRELLADARRARRRAGAAVGRRAAARLPPAPQRRCAACASSSRAARGSGARWTPTSARCTATTRRSSIVDGEIAFVGGIDLTSLAGDRFDSAGHPVRGGLGWHDVATRLRGPAVADVDEHFRARWHEVTGERSPATRLRPAAGGVEVQVVRTVPEQVYDSAAATATSASSRAYTRALRDARSADLPREPVPVVAGDRRDPGATSCATRRRDEFRVVVLLPAKPNNGGDDTRGQVGRAVAADDGGRRASSRRRSASARGARDRPALRSRQGRHRRRPLADDRLGQPQRALAVQRHRDERRHLRRGLAGTTRLRLWAEHLERDARGRRRPPPHDVVDRLLAPDRRSSSAGGSTRGGRRRTACSSCRGVSRRSMALLGPLQGLVVDG